MSFVPDSPVEMEDGTLRCQRHGLEICGICCCDYTFMRDVLKEQEEANSTTQLGDSEDDSEFVPDSPVELEDGTLRCQRHSLEICGICCCDYTFMRDVLKEQEEANSTQPGDSEDDSDWALYEEEQSKTKMMLCNFCSTECQKRCSRCRNVFYCGPEHQRQDWPQHKDECFRADPDNPNRPRLLVISIGGRFDSSADWIRPIFVEIGKKMTILEAKSEKVAIRKLHKRGDRPRAVLCGGELQPSHHPRLVNRLVNFVREGGGTAIFALCFPTFMRKSEFDKLFAEFGLSRWEQGSYHRTTHTLRTISAPPDSPLGVMLNRGGNHLAKAYSMKALHIAKPGEFEAIYSPTDESRIESMVFGPAKIEDLNEAPVAFAKVGKGWVGYVGDVNNEAGSRTVILAMLDLLG